MKIILLIPFLIYGTCLGQVTFHKTFGTNLEDYVVSVSEAYEGGYVMSGTSYFPTIDSEFVFLYKTDVNGDTLWTRMYSILSNVYYGKSIQTEDSGFAITGMADLVQGLDQEIFFLKTDIDGNPLWAKTYGGINAGMTTHDQGISILQTFDGGYIIGGNSNSIFTGDDIYLIRTDMNGDTLWTRTFGGGNTDRCSNVIQTADSGFLVEGWTGSFGDGRLDVFLIKTNANGDTLWTKCYFGNGADHDMESIIETRDRGFVLAGIRSFNAWQTGDLFFLKIDSVGNPQISKTYNADTHTSGSRMIETVDSNYVIEGIVTGSLADSADFFVLKIDSNGDTLFTKTFKKADDYYNYNVAIVQATDSGLVLTGSTTLFGAGDNDISLIKTNSIGNTVCTGMSKPTIIGSPSVVAQGASSTVSGLVTIVNSPVPLLVNIPFAVSTQCFTSNSGTLENVLLISFSPNPCTDLIQITSSEKGEVVVCDFSGKEILRHNIFAGETIIATDKLSPGLYFLHYNNEKKVVNFKLLKQ